MALIATMSFDDEDPDIHAHFTRHARDLDDHTPEEWVRVLGVFETSLREYADRVTHVRLAFERSLAHQAAGQPLISLTLTAGASDEEEPDDDHAFEVVDRDEHTATLESRGYQQS